LVEYKVVADENMETEERFRKGERMLRNQFCFGGKFNEPIFLIRICKESILILQFFFKKLHVFWIVEVWLAAVFNKENDLVILSSRDEGVHQCMRVLF
jgi:hypothetical protein